MAISCSSRVDGKRWSCMETGWFCIVWQRRQPFAFMRSRGWLVGSPGRHWCSLISQTFSQQPAGHNQAFSARYQQYPHLFQLIAGQWIEFAEPRPLFLSWQHWNLPKYFFRWKGLYCYSEFYIWEREKFREGSIKMLSFGSDKRVEHGKI